MSEPHPPRRAVGRPVRRPVRAELAPPESTSELSVRRPRRRKVPDWAWAILILVGLVAATAGLIGVSALRGDRPDGGRPAGWTAPGHHVYDREEFRDLLLGKSPDEVLAAVGRPESTQDTRHAFVGHQQNWYYRNVTRDPVTGEVDRSVQVNFRNGVVVSVNFY